MLLVYTDINHYKQEFRKNLNNLLRPYIPKVRLNKFGISENLLKISDSISNCDICLLPMDWNYYIDQKKIPEALYLIEKASSYEKKIIVGVGGDYFIQLPNYDNIIGMYFSAYSSKIKKNSFINPVIIRDPLKELGLELQLREFNKLPLIGFCGHSDSYLIVSILKIFKLLIKNIKYKLKISNYYPGPLLPATFKRKKILDLLEKSSKIKSIFIRRANYQAGLNKENVRFNLIKKEFYKNIIQTDYTICIRGTGNFSARFYETMAMGRIPIFINSDAELPFRDQIDWDNQVVFVEEEDVINLDKKIIDFHNSLTPSKFKYIQNTNRQIWEKYFKYSGYYSELVKVIKTKI